MSPEEFETCWVPVPTLWRHVQVGDVFVGDGAQLWTVTGAKPGVHLGVEVQSGASTFAVQVDPDEAVRVLTPVPVERASRLLRTGLGAQRRTTTEEAA